MGRQRIVLCFRERIDFPKLIKLFPKSWNRSRRCPQYMVQYSGVAKRQVVQEQPDSTGLPSLRLNL